MSKICDLCKTENDDDAQFCEKCGNPLVEMLEEKEQEAVAEEEAAPKAKPADLKLLAIPALLVIILVAVFVVGKFQAGGRQKAAKEVIDNYFTAIKAEQYSKAMEIALGKGLSPQAEEAFKEFVRQLTPPMPANENLIKALNDLASLGEAIDKYYHINRTYPSELEKLLPVCMEKLPPGEWGYEYDNSAENYTVFVKGKKFTSLDIPENFPAYSRLGNLQAPDRKILHGQWKVQNYEVLDVKATGKDTVQIKVVETAQFGPTNNRSENTYNLKLTGDKWMIDPDSSPINLFSLTNAFTQMEPMGGAPAPAEPPKEGEPPAEAKPPAPEPEVVKMPLGMMLLTYSKIVEDPGNLQTRKNYQYNRLQGFLNQVGLALSSYSNDHSGQYPDKLIWLVPRYIQKIPLNLAAGQDTFSPGYTVSEDKTVFTVSSQGDFYKVLGVEQGFPMFTSKYKLLLKASDIPPETEETPAPEESPEESPTPGEGENPDESPSPEVSPDESPSPGEEVSPSPGESPEAKASPEEGKDEEKSDVKDVKGKDDKKADEKSDGKKEEKKDEKKSGDKIDKKITVKDKNGKEKAVETKKAGKDEEPAKKEDKKEKSSKKESSEDKKVEKKDTKSESDKDSKKKSDKES